MKKLLFILSICFSSFSIAQDSVFELTPEQSMSITGKGPGQDAALNPYSGSDCVAIVKNLGKNEFIIRIQEKGKIIETIKISSKETKTVKLLKTYELYLDSDLKAKADVSFKKEE